MIVLKILAAPLCGGAHRSGRRGVFSVLYGNCGFRCGLCGADPACRGPVHQRPDAGRDRVPCPCVSDLSLWHPGHRGVAGG